MVICVGWIVNNIIKLCCVQFDLIFFLCSSTALGENASLRQIDALRQIKSHKDVINMKDPHWSANWWLLSKKKNTALWWSRGFRFTWEVRVCECSTAPAVSALLSATLTSLSSAEQVPWHPDRSRWGAMGMKFAGIQGSCKQSCAENTRFSPWC